MEQTSSLTTDSAGNVISELRYTAWGEVRTQAGTTSTSYTYTGQYSNTADFGLMFYNARWYDSQLGRFAQADSIVPGGVQGYDRYAYVNNNPVMYTDPTGHNPVLVLIGLIVAAAVLLDYGDNGKVDTLSPDALIVSVSVNDSSGLFQYADDKQSPIVAGVTVFSQMMKPKIFILQQIELIPSNVPRVLMKKLQMDMEKLQILEAKVQLA